MRKCNIIANKGGCVENQAVGMNDCISYSGGQLTAMVNNCTIPWNWGYWDTHYHTYPVYIGSRNTFEMAFKVVSKLLEKKIIDKLTVKEFIELVNEVQEVIK